MNDLKIIKAFKPRSQFLWRNKIAGEIIKNYKAYISRHFDRAKPPSYIAEGQHTLCILLPHLDNSMDTSSSCMSLTTCTVHTNTYTEHTNTCTEHTNTCTCNTLWTQNSQWWMDTKSFDSIVLVIILWIQVGIVKHCIHIYLLHL